MPVERVRQLIIEQAPGGRSPVYHDAKIVERPLAKLKDTEVLVKIGAVAFNHRDVCVLIRYELIFDVMLLAVDSKGPISERWIWSGLWSGRCR